MKIFIKIFPIIVITILLYYFFSSSNQNSNQLSITHQVMKGDLDISIHCYGTVQAKQSEKIKVDIPGSNKINHLIEEGTEVKKGDLLAKVEQVRFLERIEKIESDIMQNRSDVKTHTSNLEITLSENQDKQEKAIHEVKKAKMQLEKFINGDQPLEERKFKLNLEKSKIKYLKKKAKVEQLPTLLKEGFITQIEFESEQSELASSKTDYESDKLKYELYLKYDKPQGLKEKENNVKLKENELERTKKRHQAREAKDQTNLQKFERRLNVNLKKLKTQKEYLEKTNVMALNPGIVIYGNPGGRRWKKIETGASINKNTVLMTLPDLNIMEIHSTIHESEIDHIKIGQSCEITIDTKANETFIGHVTKVATIANSGHWTQGNDVKEFSITVEIEKKSPGLRPGISARVNIELEQLKNVLYIPTTCIFYKDKQPYCLIDEAEGIERKNIKLGKSNHAFTQIINGLKEGQTIHTHE